jgi:putative heme iron utilization protein
MPNRSERADAVRKLVSDARHGLLSTHGLEPAGYPYGSLVQLSATVAGEPVFLISPLAQHTKNLEADPRASVFVAAPGEGDPMQAPRAAILGTVRRLEGVADADARARFTEAHPDAAMYFDLGFQLWALRPVEARYIGGFGAAAWVSAEDLLGT